MKALYAQVARSLVEDIAQGRYPIGTTLPNEFELAQQFSVSRSTIRAAMRELQNSGLVSRKRNAGTRVNALAPPGAAGAFTQSLSSVEAVQQFGMETERQIRRVSEVVADDELSGILGCRPGRRWLHISSVRLDPRDPSGPPICWTDVYIDHNYSDDIRSRLASHRGIFGTLIEEISGRLIVEIRQTIRAIGVPRKLSKSLGVSEDAHALEIRRQYILSPSELVEISISTHPSDRYSYSTNLIRQNSPAE